MDRNLLFFLLFLNAGFMKGVLQLLLVGLGMACSSSLQFALGLTRTKYQNRFCIPNARNYRIVVNVEMSR